jgi:hypothetical protein
MFFIQSFNFTCMMMAFIKLHYQPYKDKMQQWVGVGHEIGVLIVNYMLFCFTDFVDADSAIVVANFTIFILSAEILVFFALGVIPEI